MRAVFLAACILAAGFWSRAAWADIYSWVDADGVRHISNVNPPPGAQVFLHTPAPLPKATDEEALAIEERRILEAAMRAQEEERLRKQHAALENRLAETDAKVQDAQRALERAQARLEAARERYEHDRRFSGSIVYGTRFVVTPRYDRFRRHKPSHGKQATRSIFLDRPFQLGAITIPLFNARDPFRSSEPRHPGGISHRPRNHDKPQLGRHRGEGRRH